jgi:hypothetical protein
VNSLARFSRVKLHRPDVVGHATGPQRAEGEVRRGDCGQQSV